MNIHFGSPHELPKFYSLIDELIAIGRNVADPTYASSGYLSRGSKSERAMQIGSCLDKMGGMRVMSDALDRVREAIGSAAARELEICWDGIGDWSA
jgi:hypothetical protein